MTVKNEIDFIIPNNVKLFENVEVNRNFKFNSDHRLLEARIAIK